MRIQSAFLAAAASVVLCASGSCSATAPGSTDLTGHWVGSAVVGPERWDVDLTLTQGPDSVRGTGKVVSVPARVNEGYIVTGVVDQDSVRLLLRPIEDADIHIVAGIATANLAGRLWLNNFTDLAHVISFVRDRAP